MKKTYLAPGYTELWLRIPAGATYVDVRFVGGGLSSYGITPAQYTTSDDVMQDIIEGSEPFMRGQICLKK